MLATARVRRAYFNPSHDAKGRFATKNGGGSAAFEGEAIPTLDALGLAPHRVTPANADAIGQELTSLVLLDPDPGPRQEWHAMAMALSGEIFEQKGEHGRTFVARDSEGRIAGGIMMDWLDEGDPVDVCLIFAVPKGRPGHVDGAGSAMLGEAARTAARRGVGVELLSLNSARGFYKAKGMTEESGIKFTWSAERCKQIAKGLG